MSRAAVVAALLAVAAVARAEPAVRYTVGLDAAALERSAPQITMVVAEAPAALELVFPAWLPGAYELRWFARNAAGLAATDERGRALKVQRTGPTRVRIEGHAAGARVTVRWRQRAQLLSDDGADVDAGHAYLNPGALLPFVAGQAGVPHELRLDPVPPGWTVIGADEAEPGRLRAPSYLALIDEPLEAAPATELIVTERTVAGARFVVVMHTDPGPARQRAGAILAQVSADLARIVEAERALAGPLPFQRYRLLLHLSGRVRHMSALEHAHAASVVSTPALIAADAYGDLLHVIAHELFHAWNARRLVPAELVAPDLEHAPQATSLWITEGLTEHAARLALAQAGLASREQLAVALEEAMSRARRAQRAELSLGELARMVFAPPAALEPDDDAYYAVGHVVAMTAVALLLERSRGKVGLEQLLAELLPAVGAAPRAIDTATLGAALDRLAPPAGKDPTGALLLARWVEAPFTLAALAPWLTRAGLRFDERMQRGLDLLVVADGDPLVVRILPAEGAFARAGVRVGDQILRVDGQRVTEGLMRQLALRPVATPFSITIRRFDEQLELVLRPRQLDEPEIKIDARTLVARPGNQLRRLVGAPPAD